LQRLSPHGLHWPTVDEGLDTAALTSVSLMLLGHRNATTGGSGNNLASVSPSSTVGQCKPCGDKRCKCCLQLQHAQVCNSKTTGKEYNIFCNVNYKTPNVIYLLDCQVCGSQCVGESVQPFKKRIHGHRSDLTKKTLLPVSQLFVSPGHSFDDIGRSKFVIIDHNLSWKENQ
jgi:hypothetical protein